MNAPDKLPSLDATTFADRLALTNYARAIRFSPPVAEALSIIPADKMVSGRLIFEWQTVPPAPTNTPSATP